MGRWRPAHRPASMLVGSLLLAGCAAAVPRAGGTASGVGPVPGGRVGVILPDTASPRWEAADRTFLAAAFKAAGVDYDIQNAAGDRDRFRALADAMIAAGSQVLVIVSLDAGTGAAVIKKAASAGIPVIDYDRPTVGGSAAYDVSADEVAVGRVLGEGLVSALRSAGKRTGRVIELDGAPTDPAAALRKRGYDTAVRQAGYAVVGARPVPHEDPGRARTAFQDLLAAAGGSVDGVLAADDALGGAAISVLATQGLAGKVPVAGQGATDAGLQRVLLGTQALTVYTPVDREADAAARLAVALVRGDRAAASRMASSSVPDGRAEAGVPAGLLAPVPVTRPTVKQVVADGFTTAARLCRTARLEAVCTADGIS